MSEYDSRWERYHEDPVYRRDVMNKARTIVLGSLMVFSVFAGTAALSGSVEGRYSEQNYLEDISSDQEEAFQNFFPEEDSGLGELGFEI